MYYACLKNKNYDINVAHRMMQPGSINNQVIAELYNSSLVIANLTGLNANVMYELAIRHCVRKPVIIIMEKGSGKIPFDTITERTIFYSNDFQGAIDLKKDLIKAVDAIDNIEIGKIDNPVYSALDKNFTEQNIIKNITENNGIDVDAVKFLVSSISRIENKIENIQIKSNSSVPIRNDVEDAGMKNKLDSIVRLIDMAENYDSLSNDDKMCVYNDLEKANETINDMNLSVRTYNKYKSRIARILNSRND